MITIDTNILARFYIAEQDEEAQKQNLIAKCIMQNPSLFVPRTVLLEFEWILRGVYGYSKDDIAQVMQHLLSLANVVVENGDMAQRALFNYQQGLDFADALHLAAASGHQFVTFDAKFSRRAAKYALKPFVVDANVGWEMAE